MKEENKIKLMKYAQQLMDINSDTNYNGQRGLALVKVESLNVIGKRIEDIIFDELGKDDK